VKRGVSICKRIKIAHENKMFRRIFGPTKGDVWRELILVTFIFGG
jgi:hypothetical protein